MTAPDFVDRGRGLVTRGQYQEAVKVCRLGLLANPTHVEGRLILGEALMALRRFDEVLAEMRVALEVEGSNPKAMALRGEALLRKGDALQAADMLRKAAGLAPGDAHLRALLEEAKLAAQAAGSSGPQTAASDFGEAFTKHYPAHGGIGGRPGPGSKSITRPADAVPARTAAPPLDELVIGERTGTIELDPELEGVEVEDEDDQPIDPPVASFDDSVEELDSQDVIEERLRSNPIAAPDEPTAHYRRSLHGPGRDDFVGRGGDFATGPGTTPEVPRARPAARGGHAGPVARGALRADPSAVARSGARVDELFPDPESGVSSVELQPAPAAPRLPQPAAPRLPPPDGARLPPPGGARLPPPGGARLPPPSGARLPPPSGARPPAPGPDLVVDSRRRQASEDMRTIRAGLGLDGSSQAPPAEPPPARGRARPGLRPEATAHVRPASRAPAAHVEKTAGVPRGGRSWWLYGGLAAVVLLGAVLGGLALRRVRLDRQIRSAESEASAREQADTLSAYQEALVIRRRVASTRSTGPTRAALARLQAALAAEFGEGREEATAAVADLGDDGRAEALAARAYLALAEFDAEAAQAAAAALTRDHPDSPLAPYLRGRAALLAGAADAAVDAFREALGASPRPLAYVGLGRAEAARGKTAEALAAFDRALELAPGHPAPVLHRARVLARAGALPAGNQPDDTLLGLVDGSAGADLSAEQRAWAGLALAEVKLARGDLPAAARALDATRDSRPVRSWEYSRDLVAALIAVGDLSGARAEAERAQQVWAERSQAHVLAARVAMARGDGAAALAALGRAGDLRRDAEALALRGRARLAGGQVEQAIADLDEALRLAPGHRDALAARAEAHLRAGNARAAADLLAPLHAPGQGGEVALLYAASLRAAGNRAEARDVLVPLLAQPSPPPRALLELARLERDSGSYRAAGEAYARAMQAAPADAEPRMEAALLALDTGDREGARQAFQTLVEAAPTDGRVLVEAARAHSLAGDTGKAEELLGRAEKTASAPGAAIARERARVRMRRGMFREAVEELGRAISLDPEDGDSRLLLIDALLSLDDYEGARAALREVLKTFPGGAVSHLAKGRLDLYKDRSTEALDAFRQARAALEASKAPPRLVADALHWIGRVHYFAPTLQLARARSALAQAVRLDPGHADAYYFLGLVELDDRRYLSAMSAFQKAVDADPSGNPDSWYYLGEAAQQARRPGEARAAFQSYLQRKDRGELAEEARRRLRQLR